MTMTADREASNALVQNTSFYAGALARAHGEVMSTREIVQERDRTIAVMVVDKKQRDDELHKARVEADNLANEVERLKGQITKLDRENAAERQRSCDAQREITHLKDKAVKQDEAHATVNRALIESHHERDGLRKKLHDSGEALGFLKGTANSFLSKLREILVGAGYPCSSPDEILEAVHDLAVRAGPAPKTAQSRRSLKP